MRVFSQFVYVSTEQPTAYRHHSLLQELFYPYYGICNVETVDPSMAGCCGKTKKIGGQTHTMRPIVERLGDRVLAAYKRQKV